MGDCEWSLNWLSVTEIEHQELRGWDEWSGNISNINSGGYSIYLMSNHYMGIRQW